MSNSKYSNFWQIFKLKFFQVEQSEIVAEVSRTKNVLLGQDQGDIELVRYFAVTSLAFFLIAIVILNYAYRQSAISDLIAMGERENTALAKSFANSLEAKLYPYINKSTKLDEKQLLAQSDIELLQDEIEKQTRGLPLVKIKVYNLQGTTIFSTDFELIGQSFRIPV